MVITLLDGSIGQELVKRSEDEPTPLWSTAVMLDKPHLVSEVHTDYFDAGSTVATTNTYAVLRDRLKMVDLEDSAEALWLTACNAARSARDKHRSGRLAGSIGPLIASYRPELCPPADEAEKLYADIVTTLAPLVDILLIETMSSVDQAEGAVRAATKSGKPVWLAVSVMDTDGTRLRSGEPLGGIAPIVEQYGVEAVLINCSPPEVIADGLSVISEFSTAFGAYGNGFTEIASGFLEEKPTVAALEARTDLSPEVYADFAMQWVGLGATIVGGCCEVGPAHIRHLAQRLREAGHTIV